MPKSPALIGVDWGTTSFRAALMDSRGAVLDSRESPRGIMTVQDGDFAGVLSAEIGDWLSTGRLPVLMSGMIGSRQGWIEASYVSCPAGLADLAAGLLPVPFDAAPVHIVPGMESAGATMRDVMRGEETQIFGALEKLGQSGGSFVLPGTHSKWVRADGGQVRQFSTYMTGEVYAACRGHTILGRLMQDGPSQPAAFQRGVAAGARAGGPGALLNRLFGVRTAGLFGEIPAVDLADYLSGLLIGAEITDAGPGGAEVQILGAHELATRYGVAAAAIGVISRILDADLAFAGQFAIARSAGLLPDGVDGREL
jgi:2-dehydro-3-deoxygalactonokinase